MKENVWIVDEPDDTTGAPNPPVEPRKRGRGRPRKPHPLDWLSDVEKHAPALDLQPNITDETRLEFEKIREESRRDRVSDAVTEAYRSGRNAANKDRQAAKAAAQARVKRDSAKVILNERLSATAVARYIIQHGKGHGLKARAILDAVLAMRKVCRAK